MSNQLRILIAEDLAHDVELISRELQCAGISCDAHRVETAVDFRRELEEFEPDVILSDFTMPHFNGMDALAIARQVRPNIPFIFVSGTLGEEYAIRALKNGATDYVLKSNLIRLPPAVERAMNDTRERGARREFERGLRENEKRYRRLFQNNPHPTWVYDIETLRFLAVNDAAVAHYGFSQEEFLAMTIDDILSEEHRHDLAERVVKHRTKSGVLIDVSVASRDIELEGRRARIVVASQP